MKYLLKDIVIFEGTFERGARKGQKYHWLRAALYNETNFRANPRQLPLYFAFQDDEVNMYMPYAKPNEQRPGQYIVNSVDIKQAMQKAAQDGEPMPDLLHIDNMFRFTMELSEPYVRVYNAQVKDQNTGQVIHEKGDPVIAEGQTKPVPVKSVSVMLMKVFDNETGESAWRDDPAQEVRNLLERSYKPYEPQATAPVAQAVAAEAPETQAEAETPEQKAARLQAELDALSKA